MERHHLIAIATSEYPGLDPEYARPALLDTLDSVVKLFTSTIGCYHHELVSIAQNPRSNALRDALDDWFASDERDPADWVVFYYTGHADVVAGDSLYLLTTDFEPHRYVKSSFSFQQLFDIVRATRDARRPRRVKNLLVLLDTCFAGKGTLALTAQFEEAFRRESDGCICMLAAALPLQEASAGAFAAALVSVVEDLSKRNVTQRWLYIDQIFPGINRHLESTNITGRVPIQRAVRSIIDTGSEEQRFFPNPNFVDTQSHPIRASEAQRAIVDHESREPPGRQMRDTPFYDSSTSYFTGRQAVLQALDAFMQGVGETRTHVVTGNPGSGKSAIISCFVDRNGRSFAPIDVAIHLKGKRLDEITRQVAIDLRGDDGIDAVLDHCKQSPRTIRIVVDGLDEAENPSAVFTQLLKPLGTIHSVKLLVGTRKTHARWFNDATLIDIDAPKYANETDIAEYVKARLLRTNEPGELTPYANHEEVAARVARRVAAKAYPNFLVAQLTAEDLLARPAPVDPDENIPFPTTVTKAFDAYLSGFGAQSQRVRDLLLPLAYTEGQGLPWDHIWAPLASALSLKNYDDNDVRWLLKHAGVFILESADDDRAVYRLFHEALVETIRMGRPNSQVQRVFAKALYDSVPRASDGQCDWHMANPYVLTHLATHAIHDPILGALVRDPSYLLNAKPAQVLHAVARASSMPRKLVAVYLGAVQHIREKPLATAASYLELVARQRGLTHFADAVAALPITRPWRAQWARWEPRLPHQSFGKSDSEILVLSAAIWDAQRTLALIGRRNGFIEAWDVELGERIAEWIPDFEESVWHLAFARTAAGPLIVAAWNDGHLGWFNLDTRESSIRPDDTGLARAPTAMCVGERQGRMVCITALSDRRIVIRDLPDLSILVEKPHATRSKIFDLCVTQSRKQIVLVSVGGSMNLDGSEGGDMLNMWSIDDLELIWHDDFNRSGSLGFIDPGTLLGHSVISIGQHGLSPYQLWDLDERCLIGQGDYEQTRVWVHEYEGVPIVLELRNQTLTARRVAASPDGGEITRTTKLGLPFAIQGTRFSELCRVHDRAALLTVEFNGVRVWDIDSLLTEAVSSESLKREETPREPAGLNIVCMVATRDGPQRLVSVSLQSRVTVLDADTGSILWTLQLPAQEEGHPASPRDLAISPDPSIVLSGDGAGFVQAIDLALGNVTDRFATGRAIGRLRTVTWRGQDLAFATVLERNAWAMRVWDLATQNEIPTSFAYQLSAGEEDKRMYGLAHATMGETLRVAFASKYGKVMVANFSGPIVSEKWRPQAYEEWHFRAPHAHRDQYVTALVTGLVEAATLLAAGTEHGDLVSWDFATGETTASRFDAHLGAITALAFGSLGSAPALISAGEDGLVKFWSPELEELLRLEIGESVSTIACAGAQRLAVGTSRGVVMFEMPDQ